MVLQLPEDEFDTFRDYLDSRGFEFEDRDHQVFLARQDDVVVNLYENGKVVLGGSDDLYQREIRWYLTDELGAEDPDAAEDLGIHGTRIGLDEAGKGDYLGPLVVAGVLVTQEQADALLEAGVKDSKALSDDATREMAETIHETLPRDQVRVVAIPPVKYNLLHRDMGSVNDILGWAHARALEDLLDADEDVSFALADQFGDEAYIESQLFEGGSDLQLQQLPHAEREVSVAAASIVARARFLAALDEMSGTYGGTFPKGASQKVEDFARELADDLGPGALAATAKTHFKTTRRVTGDPGQVEAILDELDGRSAPGQVLAADALIAGLRRQLRGFLDDVDGVEDLGLRQLATAIEERWDAYGDVFDDADRLHQHLDRLAELEGSDDVGKVVLHLEWVQGKLRERRG